MQLVKKSNHTQLNKAMSILNPPFLRQIKPKSSKVRSYLPACLAGLAFALLSACSGQSATDTAATDSSTGQNQALSQSTSSTQPAQGNLLDSLAALYPNGQLPADRVAQAAKELAQNPAALRQTDQTSLATNQFISQSTGELVQSMATAADFKPVSRIQNTTLTGAYFFTIYDTERTAALANNPKWNLEGAAFWASLATGSGLSSVHRFRNVINGSYLYSIYEAERANIAANYASTFAYEGVAWYAQQTQSAGWSPLYRFRNLTNGTYLFTAYETEKNAIVANYPSIFALEGVAYYVRQDAPVDGVVPPVIPTPTFPYKLPDTGISSSLCYGLGSIYVTSCADPAALALNDMQDGMVGRDVTTPAAADGNLGFSYSEVSNPVGGNFARTDCVQDNLTGLMWEGKPTTGARANTKVYSNYDSTTALQKHTLFGRIAPSQLEIDASSNTVGFKNTVNGSNLCGYSDWRIPTAEELHTIVDYGFQSGGNRPAIDTNWFPNTIGTMYWTSSADAGMSTSAWFVGFSNAYAVIGSMLRDAGNSSPVRLVRGVTTAKQYVISADGHEVIDTKTGLIWQRCVIGMAWNGSTCTGTANAYMHEEALISAKTVANSTGIAWRMPNVKELASMTDRNFNSPAIDALTFPGTPSAASDLFWSSSYAHYGNAWWVDFNRGGVGAYIRTYNGYVRLVRAGQ